MNKPTKVTLVYMELKKALGDTVLPTDLLDHAHSMVELFDEEESDTRAEFRTGWTSFDERCLDSVMSDGGWHVLCRTSKDEYECEPMEQFEWQTAWYQSGLVDQFPEMRI